MRRGCADARAAAALALAAALFASFPAGAQTRYPTRPVTLIVPFSPGTGMDVIARTLAHKFTERWGQGVVVDNKAGASGMIGGEMVAKAAPDGYTLMVTGTTFITSTAINKRLPYDPVKSFVPVVLVATGTMSLLVSANTPAQSVQELAALARQRPGALNYASSGNGTPQHLTMELFKLDAGIDMTHIPYKGTAPAINDVVGGRINAVFIPISTALPYVQQGKMRMLAILAPERSPIVPGIPTMKEAGYPTVQVENWYGMLAPAGTPQDLVARLNAEVNSLLGLPDVGDMLAKQGLNPVGGPPSRLAETMASELARWPRVVAAARIKAD